MKLSTDAKVMLLGAFLSPKTVLTFKNERSELSPRARAGLAELEDAGYVLRTQIGKEESFQLTPDGMQIDRRSVEKAPVSFMRKYGKFPMTVTKDQPHET